MSGTESFTETTAQFTPIPTLTGLHNANLIVGQPFCLSGVNATEAAPIIGFSGNSDQPYYKGDGIIEFIANPTVAINRSEINAPINKDMTFRFGPISFDTSQIEASAPSSYQTGYTKITGLINSVINGTGFPFLVSMNDVPSGNAYTYDYVTEDYDGFRATEFSKVFINGSGITHSLLSNITGEKIVISGVEPDIKGIVPPRGGGNTVITVTGYSFYNITGIRLTDVPSESTECFVESGDFVPQTGLLTTINSLGETVLTPHTGFHIEKILAQRLF